MKRPCDHCDRPARLLASVKAVNSAGDLEEVRHVYSCKEHADAAWHEAERIRPRVFFERP